MSSSPPTCGTCEYWDFKVSTEKSWGRCLRSKVQNSIYISFHIPDYEMTSEQFVAAREYGRKFSEVYFEENNFGCIHHSAGVCW